MTKTARHPYAIALCALVAACGGSGGTQPSAEELAAVRAVDEGGPRPVPSPTASAPAVGEVVSAMPQAGAPQDAVAPDQDSPVLAISAMADRPVIQQAPSATPTAGGQPAAVAEAIPSYPPRRGITTGRLCAAAVGAIMGRTELQVGIDYESPTIARVGYRRADGTQWTYDCRFDGTHITWRTVEDGRAGRWRTDPVDEVITYAITQGGATVTVNGEPVRIAG